MTFLLDTNVISEWLKARPEPRVVAWLAVTRDVSGFASAAPSLLNPWADDAE